MANGIGDGLHRPCEGAHGLSEDSESMYLAKGAVDAQNAKTPNASVGAGLSYERFDVRRRHSALSQNVSDIGL
jgi:hypothetical protein